MEYLQYVDIGSLTSGILSSFKPYYKWNTFNTENDENEIQEF